MEMREPLRNIIVHVLHDCRDGGIFSRGQDKGNIHAFFSPFVENGNCFKRVVGRWSYCSLHEWTLDIYHFTPTNNVINTVIMELGMVEGWIAWCKMFIAG